MPLQVIGAGLGRTGTSSLKAALEQLLEGPCYHMDEVARRPQDPTVWADAYEGTTPDWEAFFDGFTAAVDWPSAPFWPELATVFPDAVIVLSVRDADSWWASVSRTIFPAMAAAYFIPEANNDDWTRMGRAMMAAFTEGWQDEATAKAAFSTYNDSVRATAPAGRLVQWQPGDGWAPLCAALGVAIPDRPFPHVNNTADARRALGLEGS